MSDIAEPYHISADTGRLCHTGSNVVLGPTDLGVQPVHAMFHTLACFNPTPRSGHLAALAWALSTTRLGVILYYADI